MNTGQTMITVVAMILLMKILTGFYGNLATNGTSLGISEAGISQVSLAASYFERAQGLAFDEASRDTFVSVADSLTSVANLGIDAVRKWPDDTVTEVINKLSTFDDFDDFNGCEIDDTALASSVGTFHTSFQVYYVKPDSVNIKVNYRTFVKRMDMKIWRKYPPGTDTLNVSKVLGYFHFD